MRYGSRQEFPLRDYLAAVLPGLADVAIRRLPDLTTAATDAMECDLYRERNAFARSFWY